MSKKSRKRNKKILAAIGIGLGAAALASKRNKSIDKGIEAADADKGSDMLKKTVTPKKKPDTAKKSDYKDSIMSGGSGVKPVKKTRIKPFRSLDLGIPEGSKPLKLTDNSIRNKNRDTNAAGIKEPNKPMIASIFPRSKTADNYAGDMRDFQKTNYKSGGRVKGCGKALRGFGKAMKGNR